MKFFKWFIVFLFWIFVWILATKLNTNSFSYISNNENTLSYYKEKYSRFESVDKILHNDYYYLEDIDESNMVENAVKAYVDAINDPYTVYMDNNENNWFMDELEWEEHFEWIWAVVSKKEYYILVEELIKWSPAYLGWLKPLDRIIKVEDKYVQDETLDETVSRMRWPAGTEVNITIERGTDDDIEYITLTLTRDTINVPSVSSKVIEVWDKKIWYIEISVIWEETEKLFKSEINNLKAEWIDGVILDLRWNWWWFLDVWVQIASHFISKWELVVSARYRWYSDTNYYSKWYWDLEWIKTVVLVDWLTASAWEIIALALQEQAWAILLWTTTFWKWSIQTLHDFVDWDSLKYTVWAWYPPSDKWINEIWITPDVVVEFDATGYINNDVDNQLEEAKNLFK